MPKKLLSFLLLMVADFPAQAQKTLVIPPGAQASPNFNAETATKAYLATMPPAEKAKSDAYFEGKYWLILWDFLYGGAVLIVILETRLSAGMRDLAASVTRFRPLQTFLYWLQFSLLGFVLGFPLTVYEDFFRERQYGLMNQAFGGWFGDQWKALAVSLVFGGLLVMALVGVVRKLPRTWPAWGAAVSIVFLALGDVMGPVYIAPLFNKYTVLKDARITRPILSMARANGIPANDVYQVDASKQSKRVSANVSGFLGTERITLNDNLLNRASREAIMAVMGHEMGHYVLHHVYGNVFFFGVLAVIGFFAMRRVLGLAMDKWGARWGLSEITDVAVLPLVFLIFSVFGLILTPVLSSFVRTHEAEADMYGLNASRQPDGFAEAALLLGEYRKLDPGKWEEIIFFDHPSGRTRIYSAMRWKEENQ